jgi:hypothetical protein
MPGTRIIQWKALLLLVAFAANFTVFCHCAANAAQPHSCCEKKPPHQPCHGMQAVQFNLLEKQLADHIQLAPLPVIRLIIQQPILQPPALPTPLATGCPKHPPPDLLTLHQRFLI